MAVAPRGLVALMRAERGESGWRVRCAGFGGVDDQFRLRRPAHGLGQGIGDPHGAQRGGQGFRGVDGEVEFAAHVAAFRAVGEAAYGFRVEDGGEVEGQLVLHPGECTGAVERQGRDQYRSGI